MNAVAVWLILIACGLFLVEALVARHGLLAFAGIICVVLADLILIGSPVVGRPAFGMLLAWVCASVLLAAFLGVRVFMAQRRTSQTGDDALVGKEAVADEDFAPVGDRYEGSIRTRGELWKAVSRTPVVRGHHLVIEARHGLVLTVCSVNGRAEAEAGSPNLEKKSNK